MDTTASADMIARSSSSPRVEIIVTHAGHGHLRAAAAMTELARRRGLGWEVRQTDILDILAPHDPLRFFGSSGHAVYNWMLRTGATWLEPALIWGAKRLVRRHYEAGLALLERHWRERRPDLVVSLVPYVNAGLRVSLARARPEARLATVMLDLADTPPDFWIDPGTELLICPTDRAVEQARRLGVPPERLRRVSGTVVHPSFYDPATLDRRAERRRLGLEPETPTGVVMFGGHGSRAMVEIARRVERSGLDVQLIYLCGHSDSLATALRALPSARPRLVRGFTDRVPDYFALADFFVGKPGPNSLGEALVAGLPPIVDSTRHTLVQERYNPKWVAEKGVGLVVGSFREVDTAIARLIEPSALGGHRAAIAALENRGVFEVVDILSRALAARTNPVGGVSGRP